MEAEKIAVDVVVALTDCDRDTVAAFIRRLYLAGVLQGPAGTLLSGAPRLDGRGPSRRLAPF